MLSLFIEPGRALLDQTGITVGRVNLTKKSVQGETLVMLDMNRSHMHSTHQKLLTDPVIIHRDPAACPPCPEGVFYVGNLCVSYDIIQYNKSFPARLPQAGDLVVFANTAPYIMDFIESNTLCQNIAQKVAIDPQGRWYQDEKYKPAVKRSFA
jgi:diaminopimelate decarboxylase